MNKPRLKWKEVFLMVLPVGLLAVIGMSLRGKASPVFQIQTAPLKVVIEQIKVQTVTPREAADGYRTKVILILNHNGNPPAWWGKDKPGTTGCTTKNETEYPGCWGDGADLYYKADKTYQMLLRDTGINAVKRGGIIWDDALHRFVLTYSLNMDKVPQNLGTITLWGSIIPHEASSTSIQYVVRKAGPKSPSLKK